MDAVRTFQMAFLTPIMLDGRRQVWKQTRQAVPTCSPNMSISRSWSRRDLGKVVLGASVTAIVSAMRGDPTPAVAAASSGKQKPPPFTKDDSGIQYYDVKEGSGSTPIDGDFVIVDYVSQMHLHIILP